MAKLLNHSWFLLIIIALTWGSSFILIKKSLLEFSPYQIGAIRVGVSGLLLMFIGIPALRKLPKKSLIYVILAGFFGNFFPMFLFPLAQTQVSSSLAGILDSLVPVFVLILGFIFFGIKSQKIQMIGAILGFLGAAALMGSSGNPGESSNWAYALLVVSGSIDYKRKITGYSIFTIIW